MTRADKAVELMKEGKVNCAQAVLTAFCEELGLDRDTAFRLAQGFGGGMGRTGQTCGAVTGAYMVLGLNQPSADPSPEKKKKMYRKIKSFTEKFIQKNGSTLCKGLLGYDVSKPEEMEIIKEKGLLSSICPELVRFSIILLEEEM